MLKRVKLDKFKLSSHSESLDSADSQVRVFHSGYLLSIDTLVRCPGVALVSTLFMDVIAITMP